MYASDMRHPSPALEEKLFALYGLNREKTVELSFRPAYLSLLEKFGGPHKKLPPVIHVAGTNGKGSTIAMLRSMLQQEGYHVHAYTSPHLMRFNERIVLAGREIGNAALESLVDEALELNAGNAVTFFEITTAMAFAAFASTPADILLLETGLGGRLDCTNVIENPLCTIITAIGYDHTEFLGATLRAIAREKAGIMKPTCPCVIGPQSAEFIASGADEIFTESAVKNGSALARHGADWCIEAHNDLYRFVYKDVERILPCPNLQGTHQLGNAGCALAALEIIRDQLPVSQEATERGLQNTEWPARLQNVTRCFEMPAGWEIWLDGAHNENAAQALAAQAQRWRDQDGKPLYPLLAMMGRKDPVSFITPLQNCLSGITCVPVAGEPQSYDARTMKKLLQENAVVPVSDSENVAEALTRLTAHNKPGRILIAGSLYLAGHVLKSAPDPS